GPRVPRRRHRKRDHGQKDRGPRLRQPGPRPRPQPEGIRLRRHGRPLRGLEELAEGRVRRPRGHDHRRRRAPRRRGDDAAAGRAPAGGLRGRGQGELVRGRPDALRPRLQHPLQPDRRPSRGGPRPRRPQGSRPRAAPDVRGGQGHALALRRPERREWCRARRRPLLRPGHRQRSGRHHRDDLRRGDRDGPLRGAGRALRRALRALDGRVRDAGRGRVPAGARLLRVRQRAEVDRRPHLRGRVGRDAVLDLEHRRVRRLHGGAEDRGRRRKDPDARDTYGHPDGQVGQGVGAREPGRRIELPRHAPPPGQYAGREGRPGAQGARRRGRGSAGREPGGRYEL
ncbi:MAG: Ketol-acid reductoisomerase (NADP(+)), partial [uncultured Rubrobacteraceae bacterium]